MIKFYSLFVLLCFLLTSCVSVQYISKYADVNNYTTNINEQDILITESDYSKPYEEIGNIIIKENAGLSGKSLTKKFQKKAKEVGADAVIKIKSSSQITGYNIVEYKYINMSQMQAEGYNEYVGIAIKYK